MKDKIEYIWTEYINGNISDFRQDIKKLSKKELIQLIRYMTEEVAGKKYGYQEIVDALDTIEKYL